MFQETDWLQVVTFAAEQHFSKESFASEDEFRGTPLNILAGPLEIASDL
jgi:hypothetical protein